MKEAGKGHWRHLFVQQVAWEKVVKDGGAKSVARELLQLDDAALNELHRSERNFLTVEFVEAIGELSREVSSGLSELIPYCAQAPDVPLSIAALRTALERWREDDGSCTPQQVLQW